LPPASPWPAAPAEDAHLRRLLLESANGKRTGEAPLVKESVDLDYVQSLPHDNRDTVYAQAAAPPPSPAAGPGSLAVSVCDQTGVPLKAVKVQVSGAGGGQLVRYTNDEGFARFTGLGAGSYDLRASAPKMRSAYQRGLKIEEGGGAEATIIMDVEA